MIDVKQLYDDLLPLLKDPRMKHDGRAESWCPCHADGKKHGRRSLSLHPKYGLKCWAGCSFKDILSALGYRSEIREPLPTEKEEGPQRIYLYATPQGDVVAEKGRWEKDDGSKTFLLRRPDGDWAKGLLPMKVSDLPLYNAPQIALTNGTTPIYLVEGEKAADACIARGLLATTLAGGAGQKEFGESLQLLKGHTVILWPDNDPPGREHMVRVHARLRDIAATVRFLSCPRPLPTKGDAFDYFSLGGTAEELQRGAITEPVVEYLASDSIRVLHPTTGMTFEFTFDEITYSRNALESELTVLMQGQRTEDAFFERINLLSASQRTELRRDMDSIYGKEYDWTRTLNTVLSLVRRRYNDLDRSIDAVEIEPTQEAPFLIKPILIADGPNIIFGDGGSFKSYLAHSLAITVSKHIRVLVVDYEDNQANFRRRLRRLCEGLGYELPKNAIFYWQAHGIPLREQAHALKQKVDKDGIGLVIVDSAGPACGGKPEDAEVTLAYFRALSSLNTTTLSLCHIPKGGDTDKPFGCYSEDTEVMTRYGWKAHSAVTLDDEVACFNMETSLLEWGQPSHLWAYDYDGPMVRIHGGTKSSLDMLVTPNHRMVVKAGYPLPIGSDRTLKNSRTWHFKEAKDLNASLMEVPYATLGLDGPNNERSQDFARFLGYWISEGSLNSDAPVLTQAEGPVLDLMRQTIRDMGYDYNENQINLLQDKPCFMLRLRKATHFGRWLADNAGKGAFSKRIPDECFEYNPMLRQVLLNALIDGDGHRYTDTRIVYTTISRQLADDVQRLAILQGYSARVTVRPRQNIIWHETYTVHLGARTTLTLKTKNQVSEQPYKGRVYCLTVPTGAYVTRRNGSMAIAGNSAFWHNEARRTWLIQRVQEDDSDEIDIGLVCKKVNDGRRPSPLSFHIKFDGEEGAVSITSQSYSGVAELASHMPLGKRVLQILHQPMTAQDIADDLADPKILAINVVKVLTDYRKKGVVTVIGERTGKTGRPSLVWAKAETHRTEPPF